MQMFQHKHMGWDTLQSTSIFYIKFVKLNRVKSKATNLRKKTNIVKKKLGKSSSVNLKIITNSV